MTLATTAPSAMRYQATPVRPAKRENIRVISEMGSWRIISYLAYRHRVGLLGFTVVLLLAYITYSELFHVFF